MDDCTYKCQHERARQSGSTGIWHCSFCGCSWSYDPRGSQAAELTQRKVNLTPRQIEVVQMTSNGYSDPEIACKLDIMPRTVEFHQQGIRNRLRAKNRTHAAVIALTEGLIEWEPCEEKHEGAE